MLVTCCCSITNHPHTKIALQQQLLFPSLWGSGVLVWFDWVLSFKISGKATVKMLPRAAVSSRLLGENFLSLAWFGQDSVLHGPLHWGSSSSQGVGWRYASGPWHRRWDGRRECCKVEVTVLWLITKVTSLHICHILLLRSLSPVHT